MITLWHLLIAADVWLILLLAASYPRLSVIPSVVGIILWISCLGAYLIGMLRGQANAGWHVLFTIASPLAAYLVAVLLIQILLIFKVIPRGWRPQRAKSSHD